MVLESGLADDRVKALFTVLFLSYCYQNKNMVGPDGSRTVDRAHSYLRTEEETAKQRRRTNEEGVHFISQVGHERVRVIVHSFLFVPSMGACRIDPDVAARLPTSDDL